MTTTRSSFVLVLSLFGFEACISSGSLGSLPDATAEAAVCSSPDCAGAGTDVGVEAGGCESAGGGCVSETDPRYLAFGCYYRCTQHEDCAQSEFCASRATAPNLVADDAGNVPSVCAVGIKVCLPGEPQVAACEMLYPGCPLPIPTTPPTQSVPLPDAGCYSACGTDNECPRGQVCRQASASRTAVAAGQTCSTPAFRANFCFPR